MFKITVRALALVVGLSGAMLAQAEEKVAVPTMHAASGVVKGKMLNDQAVSKSATTLQSGSVGKGDERSIPGGPKVGPRGKDDLAVQKLDHKLNLKATNKAAGQN